MKGSEAGSRMFLISIVDVQEKVQGKRVKPAIRKGQETA
jgi:hypothetical protein